MNGITGTAVGLASMPAENNKYGLRNFVLDAERPDADFQPVVFYKMLPDGLYENGTTLEEMLRVSIERLSDLNQRFSCRENSIAITKMQEARNFP